jgi:hypothetical protein
VATAKRAGKERQVTAMPEPEAARPEQDLWRDLQPLLDQELGGLPEKYRVPVLLCDLEGKTIKEAARQLGWPQGTLAGRLARARALLAKRMTRHGLAVSGGALATVLSQNASSAGVPAAVVTETVRAATLLAAGQAGAGAVISANVAALMEGVMKTMLLTKLKLMTLVLAAAALVGGAGLFYRSQAAEPAADDPPAAGAGTSKDEPRDNKEAASASPELSGRLGLPDTEMPRQALVRLEKGQLVVQTLDVIYEPTVVRIDDRVQSMYQKAETLRTRRCDLTMVKAYDVRGRGVNAKELPGLLKKETVALISTDPQAANPLNLRLFKEGTLLFILPAPPVPMPPARYYPYAVPTTEATPPPVPPAHAGPISNAPLTAPSSPPRLVPDSTSQPRKP